MEDATKSHATRPQGQCELLNRLIDKAYSAARDSDRDQFETAIKSIMAFQLCVWPNLGEDYMVRMEAR